MADETRVTVQDRTKPPGKVSVAGLLWICVGALVLLFGLCSIFAAVVTLIQGWQEHNETQWPEVAAQVKLVLNDLHCRSFIYKMHNKHCFTY